MEVQVEVVCQNLQLEAAVHIGGSVCRRRFRFQLSARICRWRWRCPLLAGAAGGGLGSSLLSESAGGGGSADCWFRL